jgi:hypothetical protein
MKTTMSISLLGSLALMVSSVAAVPAVQARDVWSPRIISPTASTIWHLGHVRTLHLPALADAHIPLCLQHQNVTWDTSDAPASITNKVFSVVLDGSASSISADADFDADGLCAETLASGFDPRAGIVTVVVDSSIPVGTYKLTRKCTPFFLPGAVSLTRLAIVAGDASNLSPPFKVEA